MAVYIGFLDDQSLGFCSLGVGDLLVSSLPALIQNCLDLIQEEDLYDCKLEKQIADLRNQSYRVYRHKGLVKIHLFASFRFCL